MNTEFEKRFETFYNKLTEYINNYGFAIDPEITYTKGRKYIKVITSNSSYAFIDKNTGNIYKAATWSAPAKTARGNIFSDDYGLNCCGPYGVAYL